MKAPDAPKLENATIEEIKELHSDLLKYSDKAKANADNTLKILQQLSKKKIDRKILAESKIGKTMTRIIQFKDGHFSNPEEQQQIKSKAESIINFWKKVANKEKEAAQEAALKLPPKDVKLPFIPDDVD